MVLGKYLPELDQCCNPRGLDLWLLHWSPGSHDVQTPTIKSSRFLFRNTLDTHANRRTSAWVPRSGTAGSMLCWTLTPVYTSSFQEASREPKVLDNYVSKPMLWMDVVPFWKSNLKTVDFLTFLVRSSVGPSNFSSGFNRSSDLFLLGTWELRTGVWDSMFSTQSQLPVPICIQPRTLKHTVQSQLQPKKK